MTSIHQPKKFNYTPILQESHEIRIVVLIRGHFEDQIVCKLDHICIKDAPHYEALSYTWGERTQPNQIILNGTPFTVTQNLALALRQLRLEDRDRNMWVDAICINQDDPDERSNQVQQMSRIYEVAQHVHIWLGSENETSRTAMSFLRQVNARVLGSMTTQGKAGEIARQEEVHGWIKAHYHDPQNSKTWRAIARLWERNYWSRIWIIQEVVFGTTRPRQCIIHCGQDSIAWETLVALDGAMALIDNRSDDNEHSEVDIVQFSQGARLDLSWFIVIHGNHSREKELPLSYLLIRQGRYRATDLRDKVYALLSMVPESLADGLVVDYNLTTAQVYAMAMREMVMREKRLGVLCSCCRECRRKGSLEQLPSWCPDFSTDPMDKCCPARLWSYTKPIYYASGSQDSDAKFQLEKDTPVTLVAKGWYLDTIKVLPLADQHAANGFLSLESFLFMARGLEGKFPQDLDAISDEAHEAIWRTLVANRCPSREAQDSFRRDYHSLRKSYLGVGNLEADFSAQNGASTILKDRDSASEFRSNNVAEYVAAQQLMPKKDRAPTSGKISTIESSNTNMPFKEKMETCLRKRRICKSNTRHLLGLVPDRAQNGDSIIILVGCALPLILRKVNNHFIVIGESYIHGFMCGEILRMEDRGEVQREEFVIF